jgi:hypothetical protein
MNVNLWGFGVPDPPGPVRICGRLDPIPHDNDQYAFGSNWSSGVVFDTDDKTAAASTLVKFYPGVVPVWDGLRLRQLLPRFLRHRMRRSEQVFPTRKRRRRRLHTRASPHLQL